MKIHYFSGVLEEREQLVKLSLELLKFQIRTLKGLFTIYSYFQLEYEKSEQLVQLSGELLKLQGSILQERNRVLGLLNDKENTVFPHFLQCFSRISTAKS